jgi:hypothetical protein
MTHPARATYDAKTLARQDAFLIAYAKLGNVSEAAHAVPNLHPETAYEWIREDTLGIRDRYQVAHREYADWLEATVRKRLEEPQFNGRLGSDVLLIAANNAHNPERWRRDTIIVGGDSAKQLLDAIGKLAARPQGKVVEGEVTAEAQVKAMLGPGTPDTKPS